MSDPAQAARPRASRATADGAPQEEEAPAGASRASLRPRLGSAGDPGAGDHPLMTVPEAARALRVSEMTVRRAIHAKAIPFVAVGRAYRIPRAFVTGVLDVAAGQSVTTRVGSGLEIPPPAGCLDPNEPPCSRRADL